MRMRSVLIGLAFGALLSGGLVIALEPSQRHSKPFDPAAAAYASLRSRHGTDHFVSVARLTQTPRAATDRGVGFVVPFGYPNYLGWTSLYAVLGRRQYEEDWVALDGSRARWRKFTTRH